MQAAIDVETAVRDDPAERARDGIRAVENRDSEAPNRSVGRGARGARPWSGVNPRFRHARWGGGWAINCASVLMKAWYSVSTHPAQTNSPQEERLPDFLANGGGNGLQGHVGREEEGGGRVDGIGPDAQVFREVVGLRVAQLGPVEHVEEVD